MSRLRIVQIESSAPGLAYRSAEPRNTTRQRCLDRHRLKLKGLPAGLTLVATADLQARELQEPHRLLGQALAEELACELEPVQTGVLLAGDFYANSKADQLGVSGPVDTVWRAFCSYRWVAGVLGNHDRLEGATPSRLLDDHLVEHDGICIAGLGGIIGKAGRLLRRDPADYLARLRALLDSKPDLLILHESPFGGSESFRGSEAITGVLESSPPTVVICGHCHWTSPLVELAGGSQVLNVDSRVVLAEGA